MKEKPKIEILTVDFYEVDMGWLYYKLTIGEQIFDNRFTATFDPLPDFKHWLEAISIGVQQTSFEYDNEGDHIKFDFECVYWGREVLTISQNERVLIKANIDRQQIVKAFYLGLLTFASSDKFKPEEWETVYLKENLCKTLKVDEENLIKQLLEFNKKELEKLLLKHYLYSDATEEKSTIPNDYNSWKNDKKQDFIIKLINEATVYEYDGMKISDFHSSIIEKYLGMT